MELQKYFVIMAVLQYLKRGRIIKALQLKPIGYSIDVDNNKVYLQSRGFNMILLNNLPYDAEYFSDCMRSSGYHEKHWLSKRKVKRDVHYIYVHNGTERLEIETTKEHVYDYLYKQFDVVHLLEGRTIKYEDYSITFSELSPRGIGCSTGKVKFPTIVDYAKHEEKIELKSVNQ